MILDKENMFSLNQAVTATTTSDVVDLGPVDHLEKMMHEKGFVDIEVSVAAAFAATGDATLVAKLQSSTKETTDWADRMTSEQHRIQHLKAGRRIAVFRLHPGFTDRYLRIRYDITGTVTAGTVTAGIFLDRQTNRPGWSRAYRLPDSTNVLAAWSLRQLVAAYSGPVIRLRRSGDGAEKDFYTDPSGMLNPEYIEAWAQAGGGTENAYVAKWYDQSGGNYRAEQAATGKQPQMVQNGAMITENIRPALDFGDNRAVMAISNTIFPRISAGPNTPIAMFAVQTLTDHSDDFNTLLDFRAGGNHSILSAPLHHKPGDTNTIQVNRRVAHTSKNIIVNRAFPLTRALLAYVFDGTSGRVYENGAAISPATDQHLSGTVSTGHATIGGYIDTPNFNGRCQEIIIYDGDKTAQRRDIDAGILAFYDID